MASFTWEGDFEVAHLWYPFAIDKQRQLDHIVATRPFQVTKNYSKKPNRCLAKHFTPVPEVLITVSVNPHHIHIRADGFWIYLESGFYGVDRINPLKGISPDAGASVTYSDRVSEILSLVQDGKVTPDQAKTYIYSKKILERILSGEDLDSGWRSRSFVYKNAPDRSSFIEKRRAMSYIKPSVFPGKLSLLVQTYYGTENYSLTYPEWLDEFAPYPTFVGLYWNGNTEILNSQAKGAISSGLITTLNYDYWLIQVGGEGIRFVKLDMTNEGRKLANLIVEGKFDDKKPIPYSVKTRAEAYVLSTTSLPSYTRIEDHPPVENAADLTAFFAPYTDGSLPEGFILYYGWHWDWGYGELLDGQYIAVGDTILHEYVLEDPSLGYTVWIAKHVRLKIAHNPDSINNLFSVTTEIVSTHKWRPNKHNFTICTPKYIFDRGPVLVNEMYSSFWGNPADDITPSERMKYSDIPVHCYRDEYDVLHKVEFTDQSYFRSQLAYLHDSSWRWMPELGDFWHTAAFNGYFGPVSVSINGCYSKEFTLWDTDEEVIVNTLIRDFERWGSGANRISIPYKNHPYEGYDSLGAFAVSTPYFRELANGDVYGEETGSCYSDGGVPADCDDPLSFDGQYGASFGYYGYGRNSEYWQYGKNVDAFFNIIIPYETCKGVLIAHKSVTDEKPYQYTEHFRIAELAGRLSVVEGYYDPGGLGWVPLGGGRIDLGPIMYYKNILTITVDPDIDEVRVEPQQIDGGMSVVTSTTVHFEPNETDVYDYFSFGLDDPFVETGDSLAMSITGGWISWSQYYWDKVSDNYKGTVSVGWA